MLPSAGQQVKHMSAAVFTLCTRITRVYEVIISPVKTASIVVAV